MISLNMTDEEKMKRVDELCSHVWMVRTFLKHSEEAEEDEELCEVHRDLYDFMLALGPALDANDVPTFLKLAKKKLKRLKRALVLFQEIQPEISEHMNFKMAAASLKLAVDEVVNVLSS
jgi:cob(I)alamin adenosyltransferase